jgi:hypothetical protein
MLSWIGPAQGDRITPIESSPSRAVHHSRFRIPHLPVPKGTPEEVIEAIALAAKKAAEEHKTAVEASLSKAGLQISYTGPKGFFRFLMSQDDYWTGTITILDLKF